MPRKLRSSFGTLWDRPDRPGIYLRFRRRGKSHVLYAGATMRTAETFRAKLHEQFEREDLLGEKVIPAVTLAEIETEFLAHLEARHAPSNYQTEVLRFAVLVKELDGIALRDMDRGQVEDLLTRLRLDQGITPATCNRYASLLSTAFRWAIDRGYARDNPARGIKREKEAVRPVPYVSEQDVVRLIAAARDPEMAAYVRVASDTGLRRSEMLRLDWRDVDLDRGVLLVRLSKTREPREVPLTAACAAALRDQATRAQVMPLHGEGPVWTNLVALRPEAVSRRFGTLTRRAGLPDLRLHDLRHGFACRLRESGAPIQVIASLCGHKALATTMRYSRHLATDSLKNAIRALEGHAAAESEQAVASLPAYRAAR